MNEADDGGSGGDLEGLNPLVAAAAIREAIEAVERDRPDLAERFRELLSELDAEPGLPSRYFRLATDPSPPSVTEVTFVPRFLRPKPPETS